MNNLVSIITPSFNSAKFIAETINSVISQTYKNWEMIIVDDVSTDNSVQIINSFIEKDDRIKLHKLKNNSGAAVARNKAIELSKGNFIAFLDSDDLWLQNKLEEQLSFMIANNYNLTYTSYKVIKEDGSNLSKSIICEEKLSYKDMLFSNKIGCLTAIYNKDCLGKIYMPNLKKRQDYALWLKILKKESYAYGLPKILAKYRNRQESISNNKIEMLKWNWKLYRQVEKLSYFRALFYVSSNVLNKLLK
ncbi:glycosyltransferase [Polaribacter sp. MSW13]|uniref:Glycosyltransferase n=1 Tax=Polaribacter marinus TaxID=2916838 RepID=A0A9X2AJH1_9FLAO|nr:glycosyltransferase family 2 protein [Polaribacter marinus]MCI2228403.1 glycosyltransferase [Polaribacter marinus]